MAEVGHLRIELVALLADGPAAPADLPFLRRQQPGQHPQQGRLARAVGTGHVDDLARHHVDVHAAQHVAVAPPDVDAAA